MINCYYNHEDKVFGHIQAREIAEKAYTEGHPVGIFYKGFLDLFAHDTPEKSRDLEQAIHDMRVAAEEGFSLGLTFFSDLATNFEAPKSSPRFVVDRAYRSILERDASHLEDIIDLERDLSQAFYPKRVLEWVQLAREIDPFVGWQQSYALYSDPEYPLENPLAVTRALEALANLGDSESQYKLGLRYHRGNTVLKDDLLARSYFHMAASQKHAGASKALKSMSAVEAAQTFDQSDTAIALLRASQDLSSEVFPVSPYVIDAKEIVPLFDKSGKEHRFSSGDRRLEKREQSTAFLADRKGQFAEGRLQIRKFLHITPFVAGEGYGFYTGISPRYLVEIKADRSYDNLWVCVVNRSGYNTDQKTLWHKIGKIRAGRTEEITLRDRNYKDSIEVADVYFFEDGVEVLSNHRHQPPALFLAKGDEYLPTGTLSIAELNEAYPWHPSHTKVSMGTMRTQTNDAGFVTSASFAEQPLNDAAALDALLGLQGVDFDGAGNPFLPGRVTNYY